MKTEHTMRPFCTTIDCGVGTITLGEWYMVKDKVWEQAWAGRRKSWQSKVPGQEILCIGCLEQRIGRTLKRRDFTRAPINNPSKQIMSDRLRDRLAAKSSLSNQTAKAFQQLRDDVARRAARLSPPITMKE